MACPQCQVNPKSHSFIKFAKRGDITFFYTKPALACEPVNTPEKFGYFKQHMDEARGGTWIWVFDCADMKTKEVSSIAFMQRLVGTLSNEHADILQAILIINTNTWMRLAVNLLMPFMNKKITNKVMFFKGSSEMVYELNGAKVSFIPWSK